MASVNKGWSLIAHYYHNIYSIIPLPFLDVDETKLTSKVSAKLNSFTPWIPFPLGNPDACKSSGLTCPLKHNVDVDFAPVLEVKTMYPSVGYNLCEQI